MRATLAGLVVWATASGRQGLTMHRFEELSMYGEEVAAADCCPMKQLAGDTFQLDHFNLTSSKEHSCKDGCIYRDMAGRHTCFTHGKEAAVCFSAAIREEEQGGCSGPVQLDGKQQHAVDSSHINWGPDNRVPYVADSPRLTEEDRAVFREAMDYIESLTCIRCFSPPPPPGSWPGRWRSPRSTTSSSTAPACRARSTRGATCASASPAPTWTPPGAWPMAGGGRG